MIRRLIILLLIVGCEEAGLNTDSLATGTTVTDTLYVFDDTLYVTDTLYITDKHGCIDGQATNYDATASIENNTCTYIDSCGVVDIDLTNDCVKDECGVWGDDNSTCSGCIDIYALNYDNSAIINSDCNYADHTIDITDDGVSPFILEILPGESVQWNNKTSQQVGINGDIAEINYDLNSDGFIDIFIGEPINTGDHTFYLSEMGQGVIGSLLFDSAWWYSYDCIQESCVIDNAETIVEDCVEYQNSNLEGETSTIICMPLIVVIQNN